MKYSELSQGQRNFVAQNIMRVFGAMPKNPDAQICVVDCFGYEASYQGLIMRPETAEEKTSRWGDTDPVKIARMAISKDTVAKQLMFLFEEEKEE